MIFANLLGAAVLAHPAAAAAPAAAEVLPTRYEAGHFFAVPETADGQRLRLLVDTGGGGGSGLFVLGKDAVARLHLPLHSCTLGDSSTVVARLPGYKPGHGLPPLLSSPCGDAALVAPAGIGGADGLLGAGYLPGRVWTFDYPAQRLSLQGASWRPDPSAHATPLGFPLDAKGQPQSGLARIVIRVDGQPLDMLLDTGATAHPTAAGKQASGTATVDGVGVTSYITTGMLQRWHAKHPHWRVVDKGDDLFGPARATRLIEVPRVEIAGWSVGPVWFTERPDAAFHVGMARYMDKPTEGAVGGNVFGHFAMTLDYPHRTAYFRCVWGCRATPPPAP